jgi:hypothetical protein
MDPTLITALVVVGGLFLLIWLLVYINDRDRKRDTGK